MTLVEIFNTPKCLCCGQQFTSMVRVGPMVFCDRCVKKNFGKDIIDKGAIDYKTDEYQDWIRVYNVYKGE